MKAIVFSDTHGSLESLDKAIFHYKPDAIFGLGDYDVEEMELENRNVVGVRGNSYFDPPYDDDLFIDRDGFRILFTHGHKHGVRYGLDSLYAYCLNNHVDICFFGHTHIATIEKKGKIYFINPGSLGIPESPSYPTLILMNLENKKAEIQIIDPTDFGSYREVTITKDGE